MSNYGFSWISWLFLLYLILITLYPFSLILQFFGLLSLNLPFPTSFWLLFLHSSIVDIFSYIPLHPFNHTNYVYLIIIMSSLHHITSSLLHIFYIVFLIYLSPIKLLLLCLTLPQLFYNIP